MLLLGGINLKKVILSSLAAALLVPTIAPAYTSAKEP